MASRFTAAFAPDPCNMWSSATPGIARDAFAECVDVVLDRLREDAGHGCPATLEMATGYASDELPSAAHGTGVYFPDGEPLTVEQIGTAAEVAQAAMDRIEGEAFAALSHEHCGRAA